MIRRRCPEPQLRIGIAQIKQETNTYSPVPCTLEDFAQLGLFHDKEFLGKMRGRGEIGGFLKAAERQAADLRLHPILRAMGHAGGRIEMDVFTYLEPGCDRPILTK